MGSRGLAADSLARHTPSHVVVYQHRSHKDRLDTLHANTLLHNHTLSDREIKLDCMRRRVRLSCIISIFCVPRQAVGMQSNRAAHIKSKWLYVSRWVWRPHA